MDVSNVTSGATAKRTRRRPAGTRRKASSPVREGSSMAISDAGRGLVRCLGVTAAAVFALAAASQQRAEAFSLASPGTAPAAKYATDGLTTEVQTRRRWPWWRFSRRRRLSRRRRQVGFGRRLSWRSRISRRRVQGRRDGDPPVAAFALRPSFAAAAFVRPVSSMAAAIATDTVTPITGPTSTTGVISIDASTVAPAYYGYPATMAIRHRYCRVIWTYYGPRKICKYRPWHWRHRYYRYPVRYW